MLIPADELLHLVERLKTGDADAEQEFYERFGARVAFLARRELRSPVEADDVRSETMMRVLKSVRDGRLRAAEALPSFVLQTARNVVRERARQTRRFVPIGEPGSPDEPAAAEVELPDPGAAAALNTAMSSLNERDRAFLRMHFYDELPRDVIAARLGITEERVRLVKSRALQRFREAYGKVTAR
jgi:RNA polymerase sigma factor (sigma-70 family)